MESFLNGLKHSLRLLRLSPNFTITSKIVLSVLGVLGVCTLTQLISSQAPARSKPIVIAASAVLDGKSHVLHDTRIVIEGSQIVAIDPKAGPGFYKPRARRRGGHHGGDGFRQLTGSGSAWHG
jgi:hypothetical protein